MPNLTHIKFRSDYLLYENRPYVHDDADVSGSDLESNILSIGDTISYGEWGGFLYGMCR